MGPAGQEREEDEKPLDPAAERLRRKMVRLLAVSIGIMLIGVMAVLGVVVYKTLPQTKGVGAPTVSVELPADEEIVDTGLDGDRALIHTRAGGIDRLYVVSLSDGAIVKRLDVGRKGATRVDLENAASR
ncbi:fimbrial protein [Jiella pacifica]|uniref:fimbrial protein n=1 Tax=Jiella pacifica TaxID=2696469 RepID=UPI00194032E0|nr:fimbrial protein [Jiella pacifica]